MTTATSSTGITGIGQISINVHDLDRATAFYRDTLGLPLLFSAGGMAFFACGGVRLMLARPEKLYGEDVGSNYQGQTTMLSKHFLARAATAA